MVSIPPLTAAKSWRGKLYRKGCTLVPEDLAIALGVLPLPTQPVTSTSEDDLSESGTPDSVAALECLNGDAMTMAQLPTIGRGAAALIVRSRPAAGYSSIDEAIALNPKVTRHPYTVDWDKVRAWNG
ncbi:hypothetical protein ACQ4M4_12950 [Leptolyngbya sp. AN02str]|uniref:hypothetical protein n=1 Tax=Leptolyngbya sp. AN02str TaxID=3423363 RepID=UPI003D32440B